MRRERVRREREQGGERGQREGEERERARRRRKRRERVRREKRGRITNDGRRKSGVGRGKKWGRKLKATTWLMPGMLMQSNASYS